MEVSREKLVDMLYRAVDIVALSEGATIDEIRIKKVSSGLSLTITNVSHVPLFPSPTLPRKMYKDVRLKNAARVRN